MTWTTVADISNLLGGITINASSTPTSSTVSTYIDQIEYSMQARNLGSATTLSGTKFDVTPTQAIAKETVGWFMAGLPETTEGRLVVPPFTPIISINSGTLQRNKATLDQTADWSLLVEGPGDSTDYVILKDVNRKTKKEVGYAIFFYNNIPEAGRQRLRGTWVYGHNIDTQILQEYATLKASEKVILTRLMSSQPMNVATYTAGSDFGSYVNTQYEAQLQYIRDRAKEIEQLHFPKDLPIRVMQGY